MVKITQEYVRTNLFLDEDGDLFWRDTGVYAESIRHKYKGIWICGVRYYSHHIIWLYLNGYMPKKLDHWDGDEFNNRPHNLREATQSQNNANADWGKVRGVEAHGAKYRARIWVSGKRISLGSFETIAEAVEAYEAGALKYYGEFAFCARPNV